MKTGEISSGAGMFELRKTMKPDRWLIAGDISQIPMISQSDR